LRDGTLSQDPKEPDFIKKLSKWFLLYDGLLYKRAFSLPLLRCIDLEEGKRILKETHEGECYKALRIEYY